MKPFSRLISYVILFVRHTYNPLYEYTRIDYYNKQQFSFPMLDLEATYCNNCKAITKNHGACSNCNSSSTVDVWVVSRGAIQTFLEADMLIKVTEHGDEGPFFFISPSTHPASSVVVTIDQMRIYTKNKSFLKRLRTAYVFFKQLKKYEK